MEVALEINTEGLSIGYKILFYALTGAMFGLASYLRANKHKKHKLVKKKTFPFFALRQQNDV